MKRFCISILLFMLFEVLNAQQAPKVYLYENVTTMSKDSILKVGQLNISDSSYEIVKYSFLICCWGDESRYPKYGLNEANRFSDEFKKVIKDAPKWGELLIQDIVVHRINSDEGNRKLAQILKIKLSSN